MKLINNQYLNNDCSRGHYGLVATTAVTARLVTRVQDVIIDYVDAAVMHATL
jgi:hypothetical protein